MCSWYGQLLRWDPRDTIETCYGMTFWSVYKPFFSPISLPSPDMQGHWFVCCSRTPKGLMNHLSSGLKRHQATKENWYLLASRQEVAFKERLSALLFDLVLFVFCFFSKYICCRWWKDRGFPSSCLLPNSCIQKSCSLPESLYPPLLPSLEQTGIYVPFLNTCKICTKISSMKMICNL